MRESLASASSAHETELTAARTAAVARGAVMEQRMAELMAKNKVRSPATILSMLLLLLLLLLL